MRKQYIVFDPFEDNAAGEYRDALKGGPQVKWNRVKKLRFVDLRQAGQHNFFTSFSQNLGPTF